MHSRATRNEIRWCPTGKPGKRNVERIHELKPQTVRLIDLWLGRPFCFGLTLLRRIGQAIGAVAGQTGLGKNRGAAEPVRKILLIKMIEQGATVLAYRAIERGADGRPGKRVFLGFRQQSGHS